MIHSRRPAGARGFTLIEIVIGMALLGIAMVGVLTIYQRYMADSVLALKKSSLAADASILKTHFNRYLSTGHIRSFAFTGKSPGGPAGDRAIGRFLLPLPETCADLSVCEGSTALLFASALKATSASLSAICALDENNWLIDYGDALYGATELRNGTFAVIPEVGKPAEKVETGANQILSLMNPPLSTLWVSRAAAFPATFSRADGTLKINLPGPTTLPADCLAQMRKDPSGEPIPDGLAVVPVAPFVMNQFTGGGASVPAVDLAAARGIFPMRLTPFRIRSVGLEKGASPMVALKECDYRDGRIVCESPSQLRFGPVERIAVQETFAIPLANIARKGFYEIGKDAISSACDGAGDCALLPLPDTGAIRVLLNDAENPASLDGTAFSLLKQEALASIRFYFFFAAGKAESFDVSIK